MAALISAAENPRIVTSKLGRAQVLPLFKAAGPGATIDSPVASDFNILIGTMQDNVLLGQQSAQDAQRVTADAINGKLETMGSGSA